ncbi:unnamed protein product [Nesidiocoris tenuis]|uniref:Uncharacterized protein n=1 Tax=Nesidiocoris tenuis TaxID=355587 RepID=A0A6H5G778_9HEMI|nr:unnamed protein product [Nesidiocoris tenuis]
MILESEAPESEDRESGDPDSRTVTDGAQPEEREAAQTLMVVEDVKFENARTASDDEGEFAVDRSQPQQLSKLDVLGPDLQINPNYSESDDSQKPVAQPFDITNNFVTTDYQLSETGESGNQSILSETDCESDSAAIVLELPAQLLNKDERPSRDAESLRGAEMLFFSGVTNSGTGQENMTPILFFGPQAGNFVEEKIVYQVASGRHTDDSYHVSQASLPRSQISNDGQSPPTLEYEDEDQHNSRDIVKKMPSVDARTLFSKRLRSLWPATHYVILWRFSIYEHTWLPIQRHAYTAPMTNDHFLNVLYPYDSIS